MASTIKRPDGHKWVQFVDEDRKRQTIRLGKTSKKDADLVKSLCESLLSCRKLGTEPSEKVVGLLAQHPTIREHLAKHGLCELPSEKAEAITLNAWLDIYMESRGDVGEGTRESYRNTVECLRMRLGETKLDEITEQDAANFRTWLLTKGNRRSKKTKRLAPATVSRRIRHCRKVFKSAIAARKLTANPFEPVKGGTEVNTDRQHFVSREVISDVLKQADVTWQTIIALSRYGGLRTPSETLTLRWDQIDQNSMTIVGKGTDGQPRIRKCPIFPELRSFFEAASKHKTDEFVVPGFAGRVDRNLGTQFHRLIKKAGHEIWERAFHNMRASRETELVQTFPAKDVAQWLGNSEPTAMKHYVMALDENFQRALGEAESEASEADSKQNPKQHAAAQDCINWKEVAKNLPKTVGSQPYAVTCVSKLLKKATLLGLEPRMSEPKSDVLPITP